MQQHFWSSTSQKTLNSLHFSCTRCSGPQDSSVFRHLESTRLFLSVDPSVSITQKREKKLHLLCTYMLPNAPVASWNWSQVKHGAKVSQHSQRLLLDPLWLGLYLVCVPFWGEKSTCQINICNALLMKKLRDTNK